MAYTRWQIINQRLGLNKRSQVRLDVEVYIYSFLIVFREKKQKKEIERMTIAKRTTTTARKAT